MGLRATSLWLSLQQSMAAIPYRAGRLPTWPRQSEQAEAEGAGGQEGAPARGDGGEAVRQEVAESPVLVVGRRGCCLSHVVKRLLQGLGVNPAVHEVADEAELAAAVTGDEAVVALPRCSWAGGSSAGSTGSWPSTSPASSCPYSRTPACSGSESLSKTKDACGTGYYYGRTDEDDCEGVHVKRNVI
ncbi:Monothiol glutaredoxin-S5 [Hordeum vulgare]|nr:Monothiol glutaredoxin-S5 [Hordeum vulgare]